MSWICGVWRKREEGAPLAVSRPALAEYHSPRLDIFAGGNPATLIAFDHPADSDRRVFVLGNPILREDDDYRYPHSADWPALLADEESLRRLDGHWLVLIAGRDGISTFNDSLCKRGLYIHEDADRFYFTSDLQLLKEHCRPELDPASFGAYWHSLFPPLIAGSFYAPTQKSYYRDVMMLGTGGKAVISAAGAELSHRLWSPYPEPGDPLRRLENLTLLPLKAGKKVVLGLSGGMDCRPLLAILLNAKADFSTVHFGSDATADYQIAKSLAQDFGLPFRYLPPPDPATAWDRAVDYLSSRGFGLNPTNSDFLGYYPDLARDSEVFISGFFGELFRFRFQVAYLASALKIRRLDYRDLARIVFREPVSFFAPEVNLQLQRGFWSELKHSVAQLPLGKAMANPLWMNLFVVRYGPRSFNLPNLAWIDQHLIDHLPYLQSSLISGHWRYGFLRQLNEGLHREAVRQNCPALEKYPLTLADVTAPYGYRQLAMKAKMTLHYRRRQLPQSNRNDRFLAAHQERIRALRASASVRQDAAIDQASLDRIIDAYYAGDSSQTGAMLSFLSYALGK